MKPYILYIFGNCVEVDSILEIRSSCDDEQWLQVMQDTADAYVKFKVVEQMESTNKFDKHDFRIFRQLKRSLEMFKKISAPEFIKLNIEKKIIDNVEFIKKSIEDASEKLKQEKLASYSTKISSL